MLDPSTRGCYLSEAIRKTRFSQLPGLASDPQAADGLVEIFLDGLRLERGRGVRP